MTTTSQTTQQRRRKPRHGPANGNHPRSSRRSSPRSKLKHRKEPINLGAQLDDLHLTQYRETIDPKSPTIVLLSPAGSPNAFFAEQGFVGATGTIAKLPDAKTVWSADANAVLGVGKPVTLTWDNGEGLVFTRQISIDDHYVFSVTQEVQNNSDAPVALSPCSYPASGHPAIAGLCFFWGMLGGPRQAEITWRCRA
jgi:YidC/Oxa1 family membrane protein insertase